MLLAPSQLVYVNCYLLYYLVLLFRVHIPKRFEDEMKLRYYYYYYLHSIYSSLKLYSN